MKKILVIGSLNSDFSIDVEKIPTVGETVNGKGLMINNGGKGANQAYTIGKLGGNVSMLGMIGNDQYGHSLKSSLASVNVNVDHIIQSTQSETGKAFITVDTIGNNTITIIHGANYAMTSDVIRQHQHLIEDNDIILLQLEIPLDSVKTILELAKNKMIIIDPAPADKHLMDLDLSNVYLIKPNETELESLTNITPNSIDNIKRAADVLLAKGIKNVLVSFGNQGSYLINQNEFKKFECLKSQAVDTTAAGDSFIASVTLGLSKDNSLEDSIYFASKVASIVVTRKGAQSSIPDISEVTN